MILGIVGSEEKKFTSITQKEAFEWIETLITTSVTRVVSGGCHLGGIDKWAIEIAKLREIETEEFLPANYTWTGGYKPRNIKIAEASDKVVCITLAALPCTYKGMTFPMCYHCKTNTHVKSGGCWTMHYAAKLGKETQLVVI